MYHRGLIPLPFGLFSRSHGCAATSREVTRTSNAQQKEKILMRLTKRNLIKTAAVGSALLGAVAVAAPASANSFGPTDYGTGGRAIVSYDDGSDQFCVTGAGHPLLPTNVRVYPETRSRGPEFNFNVRGSETKCVSLGRAFEDSYYYFKVGDASPVNFYS